MRPTDGRRGVHRRLRTSRVGIRPRRAESWNPQSPGGVEHPNGCQKTGGSSETKYHSFPDALTGPAARYTRLPASSVPVGPWGGLPCVGARASADAQPIDGDLGDGPDSERCRAAGDDDGVDVGSWGTGDDVSEPAPFRTRWRTTWRMARSKLTGRPNGCALIGARHKKDR